MSAAAGAHDLILAEVNGKCQFVVDSGKEVKSSQQPRVRQLPCQILGILSQTLFLKDWKH